MTHVPSKKADQHGNPSSLISLCCPHEETFGQLPIECISKTLIRLCRLSWVFARHTCHIVGFVMLRLKLGGYLMIYPYSSLKMYVLGGPRQFGTYRLCEQLRFRRACASAQSCQNLHCSLIQAVSQDHSYKQWDRKPDPWPLWMAGHVQSKFIMRECSKTQIY